MKKVLMIAYFFPPVGGIASAGSQRTLKFAKYLGERGWQPVVLTVREDCYERYFVMDPTLLERVPPDVKIARSSVIRWLTRLLEFKNRGRHIAPPTAAAPASTDTGENDGRNESRLQKLKDAVTGLFEIPDEEIGWLVPGVAAGIRVVRRERVDVLYSTGKPWTAHLVAAALKKLTGRPLVVDFRDPWMTNPFRGEKSPLRDRVEAYLERKVVETADVVVTNTKALRDEFIARFPEAPAAKFVTLLNGFDPDDYDEVSAARPAEARKFTIAHTGFLYGKRDPRGFLEAVSRLIEEGKIAPDALEIVFVGSIELPYDLPSYLRAKRLAGIVRLIDQVPYRESLRHLAQSDALLLLQPGTMTQVPSKLFEYIALGKPILAVSPRDGATSRLVLDESLGRVADADSIEEIATAVEDLYRIWRQGGAVGAANGARSKFDVRNVTAVLAEKFDDLLNRRATTYP